MVTPYYPSNSDLSDMFAPQGKLRVIPHVLRHLKQHSSQAYAEPYVQAEDVEMVDASTSATVIDHTAFPHIIDTILAYASNDALLRFRATSTEYYARITSQLAGLIHVVPGRDLETGVLAMSGGKPLFRVKSLHPEASKKVRHIAPRDLAFKKHAPAAPQTWHEPDLSPPPPSSPASTMSSVSSTCSTSSVSSATSLCSIDLAPRAVSTSPMPLFSYTRVIDIEARKLKPAHLYPLSKSLRRMTAASGGTPTPSVPLLRLLDFPAAGWGHTCPIVADTLVVFMMDIFACPVNLNSRLNNEPPLVPEGTKRVVVNICGQHMISYANLNALYDLPASLSQVVFHLVDATCLDLHCPRHDHNVGFAYLGVIMGRALSSGREVLVTVPKTKPFKSENRVTSDTSVSGNVKTITTISTTQDNVMTTTTTHVRKIGMGPRGCTVESQTSYQSPTPIPGTPLPCPRQLLTAAAEQYLVTDGRGPEEVHAHLSRLAFYTEKEYINAVGQHEWLWEARP